MNLFESIKSSLTNEAISGIASFIGANEETTKKATDIAIPSLINGISNAGSSSSDFSSIFNIIKGFLGTNTSELGANTDLSQLASSGSKLIGDLMGNNALGSMSNAISTETGLSSDASSKLLSSLAPTVVNALSSNSGGESGFASFLGEQGKLVAGLLPAGIAGILGGLGSAGNTVTNIGSQASSNVGKIASEVGEVAESGGSLLKKMFPLLILLLLAGLLWMFFNKGCKGDNATSDVPVVDSTEMMQDTSATVTSTLDSAAMAAKALWESTLGKMTTITLPGGATINVPEMGFEKQLVDFLNNGCKGDIKATWFNCDRLLFKTGSAELNEVSMEQITNLATIFNAYPNAKFKIGGYTDNVGNPASNKKLSGERAASVLNALVGKSVKAESVSSEGYGQEHPVCPENNTDECKAKNRRVAIRVEQCN